MFESVVGFHKVVLVASEEVEDDERGYASDQGW